LTVPSDRSVLADKEQGARAPPPAPTAGNGQQSRLRSNPPGAVSAVRLQLADECDAMARHALGSGLTVPAWVLDVVERSRVSHDSERSDAGRSFQSADPYESGEWDVMSLASGPPARLDELGRAHSALARMIRPATPRGILLLTRGRQHGRLRWLGPVRLIRQMLMVVIVMLAAFVVLALSPDIHSNSGDIFNDSGTALLVNELFYLTAGGLGAAFYALFTAYQYIAAGTYDTTYESSYWIRYILGLIAGVVLPSLIPVSSGNSSAAVTRPLLALLGGFSAAVLYRILQRFVEIVEALAEGDSKRTEQARNEALTARGLAQMGDERLALVGELVHLRDELDAGQPVEQARASVEKLLAGVAPHGTLSDSFGPTPGADR
jgi:hypothetical protein